MQPRGKIGFAGHGRLTTAESPVSTPGALCLCAFAGAEADCRGCAEERSSDGSDAPRLRACISALKLAGKRKRRAPAKKHWPVSWWSHTEQVQLDAVLHKAWFATKASFSDGAWSILVLGPSLPQAWTELVMLRSEAGSTGIQRVSDASRQCHVRARFGLGKKVKRGLLPLLRLPSSASSRSSCGCRQQARIPRLVVSVAHLAHKTRMSNGKEETDAAVLKILPRRILAPRMKPLGPAASVCFMVWRGLICTSSLSWTSTSKISLIVVSRRWEQCQALHCVQAAARCGSRLSGLLGGSAVHDHAAISGESGQGPAMRARARLGAQAAPSLRAFAGALGSRLPWERFMEAWARPGAPTQGFQQLS